MAETKRSVGRPPVYPPEVRERAVRMVFEARERSGQPSGAVARIARELGVNAETLRTWVRRAEVDSRLEPGVPAEERQRIAELERENRELRRANDALCPARCLSCAAGPWTTPSRARCTVRRDCRRYVHPMPVQSS